MPDEMILGGFAMVAFTLVLYGVAILLLALSIRADRKRSLARSTAPVLPVMPSVASPDRSRGL
ncbi:MULTISPECIES: hypothetical protein [unclassified Leucobacter]|uniref:hypothetical protein n=1 Tax=unclassified Leucobacter TaxID=2621730 RepID=UPI00165D7303|nr:MULTISPECIES: hypothetical protein [unclassified Leucobacter]MBC9928398.1 hypothetical protein [Leucobacter sp. cx-169]